MYNKLQEYTSEGEVHILDTTVWIKIYGQRYADTFFHLGLFFNILGYRQVNPSCGNLEAIQQQSGGKIFLYQHDNTPIYKARSITLS